MDFLAKGTLCKAKIISPVENAVVASQLQQISF